MPLNRSACLDVLTVDAFATTTSKTISNFYDKRRSFKFARKEKISTWELIEGVKNASSLCLSWYGSTKLERKMLRYEYQQKLLLRHKHLNIHKELTYFKDKSDVPNDLMEASEPTITVVVPPPPPPAPVPMIKKELKVVNPLSLTPNSNQIESGMKINSPSTLNPLSADVILIGSNAPPHMMQQPGQSMPMHQINPTHNQVLSRMQQMHQGQQQQQQQMQQFQQNAPNPNDRKGTNRSLSTPDKQRGNGQGGSAKKRNPTTPRRANSNIRGANANAAAVAAVSNPAMTQPNQIMPNNPQYPMGQMQPQQKIIAPQQQQQQPVLMQQRSTNSPMLQQQQQQQQQANFNNPNFMSSNRPVVPNTQQNPMQSMPPHQQQMNQPRMPNPAAQSFTNPNGQIIQAPINQPQPNQQFMAQTQPQAQPNPVQGRNMMQNQANRMSYAPPPVMNPAQQQQQQQQQQRKLPTQPVQQQQVVLGQQQKQAGPIFNAAQQNQAGRIIPNQPNMPVGGNQQQQQMFNQQKPPTTALPAPRTTTPDPMMMQGMAKQQAPGQNAGFMTQGQQRMPQGQAPQMQPQQQQPPRMQFNQGQPNANQGMMNQNQLAWQQQQQQQRQQQQGMQQQPRAQNPGQMAQGQPQQQFQQQPQMQSQQFMQKQQLPNQVVI